MGGKNSTSTSQVSIPQEVLQRYNAVNARAEDVAQTGFQPYGGQFVSGLTGTQQAGLANTNAAQGMAQPYIQAGTNLSLASAQDLKPEEYSGDQISKYMNPYVSSVYDATAANINRQNGIQQQQLQGDAIKANAFGGDRGGIAKAELARTQNLAGQQTLSNILQQGFQGAQGEFNTQQQIGLGAEQNTAARQAAAGQTIGSLGVQGQQAALAGAGAQMQAGQVEQATNQADLTAQYNQFLQQKSYPFQVAQFLANIAMGTGALSGSTTTSTSPAPFFSDERLKENMAPVGKTFDGQPIYRFNYKGDPRTQIGLVAQDVAHSHPDAVGEDSGYLTVDYDKATRHAAEEGLGAAHHRASGGLVPYQPMGGQSPYPNPASYVPQAMLPVGQLVTAKTPEQKQSGGLGDIAKNAQSISSLAKDAKGLYKWADPDDKPANFGPNGENLGGFRADGGEVDMPEPDYPDADSIKGPDVHSFVPKADLPVGSLKPADAPKNNTQSPFGEILDVAKTAAKFAMMSRGGEVEGYLRGGAPEMDPDEMAIRTLVREAGGEPDEGVAGVGHVILNRVNAGGYGDGLSGVITKPKQFSPWNTAGTGSREDPLAVDMQSPAAQRAAAIWNGVKSGDIPDPTNGAVNFYNPRLAQPTWGRDMQNRVSLGNHDFGTAGAGRDAAGLGNARAYAEDGVRPAADVIQRAAPRDLSVKVSGGQRPQYAQAPGLGSAQSDAEKPGLGSRVLSKFTSDKPEDDNAKMALFAGLMGMLSSKSHWLLPAIGEGGLAGVETYKSLAKQDADIENTRANAANTRMEALNKGVIHINGQAYVQTPDGLVLWENYKNNPVPLAGTRNSNDLVKAGGPSVSPGSVIPRESSIIERRDLPPPPTVAAPAAGASARPQDVNAQPSQGGRNPLKPPPPPPNLQPGQTGSTVQSQLSAESLAAADKEGAAFSSADPLKHPAYAASLSRAESLTNEAQARREAAERTGPIVNELAKTIANTPREGWLQSGAWAEARAKIGRELNQVLTQMGMQPFADPSAISNADIQDKLKQIQAGTNAQNAQQGHVAAYMIDQYKATVPNASMTPEAQAELMAQNYVQQQREIDRHQALGEYRKRTGARNGSIPGTANDFEDRFASDYNRTKYLEDQEAIKRGLLIRRTYEGKPTNAMQLILDGRITDPQQIDKVLGRPGIHRYFTGASSKLRGQ